ncbi:unnamed protein product [Ectocarpus fasciculatus]
MLRIGILRRDCHHVLFLLLLCACVELPASSAAWPHEAAPRAGEYVLEASAPEPDLGNVKASGVWYQQHADAPETQQSFTCTNEYPPLKKSKWAHVAEPFRDTTFTAFSSIGNLATDVFQWSFQDGTVLEGRRVKHKFKAVGRHEVSLMQIVVSTGEVYHMRASVMVKYVRREIRQLTDKDREAFFDAMETLYRLPTPEGVARYGKDYKGIELFVQMHLDGAGVKDCDHWHDDAGIMTHHVGFTLLFEQALQVVDPSVSIPYWEYTIEATLGLANYGESHVFDPDWFGDASPDNPLHTVTDGRWAYLSIMKARTQTKPPKQYKEISQLKSAEAWDYVHNPFGLLRAPWNTDGTPFVTRHDKINGVDSTDMVTCGEFQSCFESSSIAKMNNCLNAGVHGPVHNTMGGEWSNPEEELTVQLGYSASVAILSKALWRQGYLRVPNTCLQGRDGSGNASTCITSCPAELYESLGMTPYDVLVDTSAAYWVAESAGGAVMYDHDEDRFMVTGHEDDEDFQNEFWVRVLHSLCDPGRFGDQYSATSAYDPLFWVIHPTLDRLLGWRRKLAADHPDKWSFDDTWGYLDGNMYGETRVVCDWSAVSDDPLAMPTCVEGNCEGHQAKEVLPFEIKLQGETVTMTNLEWYQFIHPDNDNLPYMYNEFSWDHCAAGGYYMGTEHPRV